VRILCRFTQKLPFTAELPYVFSKLVKRGFSLITKTREHTSASNAFERDGKSVSGMLR